MDSATEKKRTKHLAIMALLTSAILGSAITGAWNAYKLNSVRNQTLLARKIDFLASEVNKLLTDVETGTRGKVLTGEEEYLEPYIAAKVKLKDELRTLSLLAEADPSQSKQIKALVRAAEAKVTESAIIISLPRLEGAQRVLSGQEKRLMDAARKLIQEIRQKEQAAIAQLVEEGKWRTDLFVVLSSVLVLSGLSLLGVIGLLCVHEIKFRGILNEQLSVQLKFNRQLLGLLGHDLRLPLNVLVGFLFILKQSPLAKDPSLDDLWILAESALAQMEDLLRGAMLELRTQMGALVFLPKPVDAVALCWQLIDVVEAATRLREFASPLCLVNLVEREVIGTPREALLDEALIRQILPNLLSNAIKYSQGVTNPVPVKVTLVFEPEGIRLQVSDRGIGIPEVKLANLNQAFDRAANAYHFAGEGLGLTFVIDAVRAHQGQIKADSKEGEWTTFDVWLPA